MEIDLVLKHDKKWVAEGSGIRVEGENLRDVDEKILKELKKRGVKGKIRIFMRFDYSTFPRWMVQFHPYYFNRTLEFDLEKIDPEEH